MMLKSPFIASSIDVYVLAHSNDLEYWPNDLDLSH